MLAGDHSLVREPIVLTGDVPSGTGGARHLALVVHYSATRKGCLRQTLDPQALKNVKVNRVVVSFLRNRLFCLRVPDDEVRIRTLLDDTLPRIHIEDSCCLS